jgi:hypothetical protein
MTIEAYLERIAGALETQNVLFQKYFGNARANTNQPAAVPPLPGTPLTPPPALPPETKAAKPPKAPKAPKEAAAPAAPTITMQHVADGVMDVANNVNRKAAIDLMAKFGAQRASELKPEQFEAVLKDVAAVKAAAAKPAPVAETEDSLI